MSYCLTMLGDDPQVLDLEQSFYAIGSSPEDDIYCDVAKENHVRFIFIDHELHIQAFNAPIWINGKAVKTLPSVVKAEDVLTVGERHFFFAEEGAALPQEPTIVNDTVEETSSTKVSAEQMKKVKNLLRLALGVIAIVLIFMSLGRFYQSYNTTYAPVPKEVYPERLIPTAEEFARDVLGDALLSVAEDGDEIEIHILSQSDHQNGQWAEDLTAYSILVNKSIKLVFITEKDLVLRVSKDLHSLGGWKTKSEKRTVYVQGICTSNCAEQHEKIRNYVQAGVKVVDQVRDVTIDFKIHSLTVSKNTAQATLSRHGQYTVVQENGPVYNIGILSLIRYDGIEITTADGKVFIPWNKS